jgi:hypothetical protein
VTRRSDPGGGGLTGVTGDLTPDESAEPFVPGERREQSGELDQGAVTHHQGAGAPAQQGEIGAPGSERHGNRLGESLTRESGYGSEHGLSPNDPAYRMEVAEPGGTTATDDADRRPDARRQPARGVDEVSDSEERF